MSWEEIGKQSVQCPCGKGLIIRTDYGDDWNRIEEKVMIDCPYCSGKYKLISKSWYKHAGDSGTAYYLLDKNYPIYSGVKLTDVFSERVNIYNMPFAEYLIKTYTTKELVEAAVTLNNTTSVSRLTGVAFHIAEQHKKAFHSARVTVLRQYVEEACCRYSEFVDNKDCRLPLEQQEEKERLSYEEEMRKHMIYIPL